MKEEQGKKLSQLIPSPPTKASKVPVPDEPTALSDEDLNKVVGGAKVNGGFITTQLTIRF